LEYLKQLWNTTLLGDIKTFQVVRYKCKKITNIFSEDKIGQQSSKKTKEKQSGEYCMDAMVKIEGVNPCGRHIYTRQNCLLYNSR